LPGQELLPGCCIQTGHPCNDLCPPRLSSWFATAAKAACAALKEDAKRIDFLHLTRSAAAVHWHSCRVFGDFWSNRNLKKSPASFFYIGRPGLLKIGVTQQMPFDQ
jgi:hypothetical protein